MPCLYTTSDLRDYQRRGIEYLTHINHGDGGALFIRVGGGKTVTTLYAIRAGQLSFSINRVLVVSTKTIIRNVWRQEAKKWDYLEPMTFSLIDGTKTERDVARRENADVHLVGIHNLREHLDYFIGPSGSRDPRAAAAFPYDVVVFDELTKIKNLTGSKTGKSMAYLRTRCPNLRVWGMTGTPLTRHPEDLWGLIGVLDGGRRLGGSKTAYMRRYFEADPYQKYKWTIRPGALEEIVKRIGSAAFLIEPDETPDVPPVSIKDLWVPLPERCREMARKLRKDGALDFPTGTVRTPNAGVLISVLRQLGAGGLYLRDDFGRRTGTEILHEARFGPVDTIMKEASGPVLVMIDFRFDINRVLERYKGLVYFHSGLSEKQQTEILRRWKAGTLRGIVGHPASMGHGLDGLQFSGSTIIFLTPSYNWEHQEQVIGRLARSGSTASEVIVYRIWGEDWPVDDAAMLSVAEKNNTAIRFLELFSELAQLRTSEP